MPEDKLQREIQEGKKDKEIQELAVRAQWWCPEVERTCLSSAPTQHWTASIHSHLHTQLEVRGLGALIVLATTFSFHLPVLRAAGGIFADLMKGRRV